jgi:hypothetical protein
MRHRLLITDALKSLVLASAQEQDEKNEGNRNSDEPKQNRHVSLLSYYEGLAVDGGGPISLLAPGAVAKAAAFGSGKRG